MCIRDRCYEVPYTFLMNWQMSTGTDVTPTNTWNFTGRPHAVTAPTTGLAAPADNTVSDQAFGLFVDNAWDDLGTTQIEDEIRTVSVSWTDYAMPEFYGNLRTDHSFSTVEFSGNRLLDIAGTVAMKLSSGFVIDAEADKLVSRQKFVRLRLDGAEIDTLGSAAGGLTAGTYNESIWIDGAMYHAEDSVQVVGEDSDGLSLVNFHFTSAYDATGQQDARVIVTNEVDAFPS